MPKIHPQPLKNKVKKLFFSGHSCVEIAAKCPDVALPSIRRWARDGKWYAEREAREVVTGDAIQSFVNQIPESKRGAMDHAGRLDLVNYSIHLLVEKMGAAPVRSLESAMASLAKLMELQIQLDPPDMKELAKMAINTPGFNPEGFVKELKAIIYEES